VQVCPTGIDIRDGLQLECVSCTACIDACDAVMERIGKPRGLVRYDSLAGLARRPKRVWRTRVVLYLALMLVAVTLLTTRVAGRDVVGLSVTRAPGIPYLVQADGRVRNLFTLHLSNTDASVRTVTVELEGPESAELLVPGQPFEVPSGGRVTAEVFVLIPQELIGTAQTAITFRVMENGQVLSQAGAVLLGPVRGRRE